MRLKRLILFVLAAIAIAGCYDDSKINASLEYLEARVQELERICDRMNSNVSSLQAALDALQKKDFVTGTSPLKEGDKEIGYTITFSSGKTITIYHGQNGKSPSIGVKADIDGVYYWTLDGEWLRDGSGIKIPATGPEGEDAIAPKLQIKEGYWYISYDDGDTWENIGKASGEDGEDGDSFFKSVVETDDAVVMTLADGTLITLPKKQKIDIIFEGVDGSVGIMPGEKRSIPYNVVNGSDNCLVKAFGQNGWSAKVDAKSPVKGTLTVTAPQVLTDDEIIVLVYDGESTTIMKTLSFEGGAIICDVSNVRVKGTGETVLIDVESNLAVSASSSASWIKCKLTPATKAMVSYTLQLVVSKNFTEEERAATVSVSDPSGKVVCTVGVVQSGYDAYETFSDLSQGGETANCYIINSAGQYKFPIIKGNGQKGVIISGDTAELPGARKAKIVWQDADIISSVGVNKGYLVFETYNSWRKGNAVVAVTDESGTILWSWHIWSTDYVLGTNDVTVYNNSKSRTYKMMNLALGEVGSTAPFYQFGRKDPFPKKVSTVSSGGTLAKSIKNPDVFYGSSGYDWCSDSRSDWWDAGYKSYNSSSSTASVLKGNKTIYDPCPVGYRVPPDDAFTNFTKSGQNTQSESYINSPNPDSYSFWYNDNAYDFYTGEGRKTVRFKAFGGLNASKATYLTNIAYYYSAHPSYSSTGRLLQFYAGVVRPLSTEYSRALAGNIRPIRNEVESEDIYESTDYSKDGTTVTIQRHTKGKGIKILIVGDGFTDKDIASGKYDRSMQKAADYFFDIEPYKTFRDRFDVINMRVVSPTSVFDDTRNTAFETVIGPGVSIEGNLEVAYQKVRRVYGSLDDVLVIVVLNTTRYAGTCWMVGDMISIAFCPMSEEYYYPFDTIIHHEAGGHGFANLGDEYSYNGSIPQSEKDDIEWYNRTYGWYENIDVTSDRSKINWSDFLADPMYSSSTGVYEGAYGYSYGVWRPTYESCMNSMYGNFNAPSRYAIYKRIMERSGESWSWEDFVQYDKINRASDAKPVSGYKLPDPSERPPHARPVYVSPETLPY